MWATKERTLKIRGVCFLVHLSLREKSNIFFGLRRRRSRRSTLTFDQQPFPRKTDLSERRKKVSLLNKKTSSTSHSRKHSPMGTYFCSDIQKVGEDLVMWDLIDLIWEDCFFNIVIFLLVRWTYFIKRVFKTKHFYNKKHYLMKRNQWNANLMNARYFFSGVTLHI
jgi:hypothetical protein